MSSAIATPLDEVGIALLEAAGTMLADQGAAALTVRGIAAAAGMSTMNVYSRFGGKDGVVEHLYLRGFGLLADAMREAGETDDPLLDLHRCGLAYRRFAIQHASLYGVMFERVVPDFEPTPAALDFALGTLGSLAALLQRAMESGVLRTADPIHAAAIVWSTCHGVISLELKNLPNTPVDWERVFADATAAVLAGLKA